jgi:hypothetical protein
MLKVSRKKTYQSYFHKSSDISIQLNRKSLTNEVFKTVQVLRNGKISVFGPLPPLYRYVILEQLHYGGYSQMTQLSNKHAQCYAI